MRCLIVDDDPLICDLLEHFCSKLSIVMEVTVSNSGFEAVNLINDNLFDIIFLDYNLPDITGKEILSVIEKETFVIMITSNKDFAHESYNYDQIVDYLVKPIEYGRFFKGIQKVQLRRENTNSSKDVFFLKDGNALTKIILRDVLFIQSAGNYLEFVFEDRKVMTLMTMKDLVAKLPSIFQRTHRSFVVNTEKVEQVTNDGIKINSHLIPVSETYEKDFMVKLNLWN